MRKKIGILLGLLATTALFATACKDKGGDSVESVNSEVVTSETSTADSTTSENATPSYTITWMNEQGAQIATTTVSEGETPAYNYTVADTAEWDYTFEGWATAADGEVLSSIPVASANATYYAKVSAVKQIYTVTFNSAGGSEVAPQTVTYGELATEPTAPTYSGYKFVGWSTTPNGDTLVDFTAPITGNATYYAVWNQVIDVKGLLSNLLDGYKLDPMSYIPETMRADYSANLVAPESIVTDYSTFVNTSDITYGFGEQWQMVLTNLKESERFFNVLSVVDTLSTVSITAFNNYFDSNPSNTAHHTFANGIYNITVNFDGETIFYVLDYTASIPLFGEQTVQIALAMDVNTNERVVRVQIGDANALTYTVTENAYTFAVKYLGVRRAMFSISQDDDGNVQGNIYEYLTAAGVEVASAADFYINDDYVTAVGNKASGLVLFDGYVCEVYNANNGKMLGYEVKETTTVLGKEITFNTLWFDFKNISGINSIKCIPDSLNDMATVNVNGSSKTWEPKKVSLIGSRRFDIELRTQYVYSYDAASESYVAHEISVPMIFVQEEYLDTFISDVKSTNDVTISFRLPTADIEQIISDYTEYVPIFMERKELITVDIIIAYIGEKIILSEVL